MSTPLSKTPEYRRAYQNHRYATDPEFRKRMRAATKRWIGKNRDRVRGYDTAWRAKKTDGISNGKRFKLKYKYGVTVKEYKTRVAACGGLCQACGKKASLNVDHAHDDGHVRGMLCGNCNRAIGLLGDGIAGVEGAMRYLQAYL